MLPNATYFFDKIFNVLPTFTFTVTSFGRHTYRKSPMTPVFLKSAPNPLQLFVLNFKNITDLILFQDNTV